MDNQFPKMLYRLGGTLNTEAIHGGHYSTKIVNDEAEQEAAVADGWRETTPAAKDAHATEERNKAEAIDAKKRAEAEAEEDRRVEARRAAEEADARRAAEAKRAEEEAAEAAKKRPPTREELEQQATELEIPFGPKTSDKKLAEAIDAKLAEPK